MIENGKPTFLTRIQQDLQTRMPWLNFVLYVFARGQKDQFLRVAASLSYTSLIALVPLIAISVAIFSAFPAFAEVRGQVESFISQSLVPNAGQSVEVYLKQFINATEQLTTIGVIGLGVTALLTLTTIEAALNTIFRVVRQRPMVSRVLVYWAVLTLGPLLLGVSSSLSGGLFALGRAVTGDAFEGLSGFAAVIMPNLFTWAAFTLLYLAVPNRQVALRDALIGGAVAMVMFALLRFGFAQFVASANTYRTLYGALAVIPLFLMSMYMSWAVVLFGAVMTAAFPEWRAQKAFGDEAGAALSDVTVALDILTVLRAGQVQGRSVGRRALLAGVQVPEALLEDVLVKLKAAGFADSNEAGDTVVLRDLSETPMSDLLGGLGHGWTADAATPLTRDWQAVLSPKIAQCLQVERDAWRESVRSVLDSRQA